MAEAGRIKDRYGLEMTTSSVAAAEYYSDGVDRLLEQGYGAEEGFANAIEADEGFALAHGGLALMRMLRAKLADAKASAERAKSLSSGVTRRERQHVEAISLYINNQGHESLALIREHLTEYPRDAMMLRLANRLFILGCSGAGIANFPDELLAMLKGVESNYGEDWAFLGQYAFAHHETGLLDDAERFAQRSLDMRPTNANASHSVAHVFFERGDHNSGQGFLANWLGGYDKRAPFRIHLSWHLALFELARGQYQRVLDLYESDIRPSVAEKSPTSLADGASLMWRLQIYNNAPPPASWDEVREQAAPAAEKPGPAFRDAHAALAFAASGHDADLGWMIDGLKSMAKDGNALATEVTLPLVKGIGAFVRGEYAEATRFLNPLRGQLVRIGGSHAQREVFEDTILEANLRAGQYDIAEDMLRSRLNQRTSVRDMLWLGRAQEGRGQADEAKASLSEVSQRWQNADPSSPEVAMLNRLSERVSNDKREGGLYI